MTARITLSLLTLLCLPALVAAHDPVFAPGPHTLFRGGSEVHLSALREQAGGQAETEYEFSYKYGLTGDWTVGLDLPLEGADGHAERGPLALRTKWRFWRRDRPGVQDAAALAAALIMDSGPAGGATDWLLAISRGRESLRWYWWLAARYRINGRDDGGLRRGDRWFADAVIGIRPRRLAYREPDSVWMLELNVEGTARSELHGARIADSGGTELFLSPGLMWTWRNLAIKPGVQIPLHSSLRGAPASDHRAHLSIELHL